jgi:serpin B
MVYHIGGGSLLLLGLLLGVSAWSAESRDTAGDQSVAAVVKGNDQFAFDLYARLRDQPGNLFLSPYSISDALAMTSLGARGETAAQMAKVLHFPPDGARVHPAFAALVRKINGTEKQRGYQLRVADALWGQKDYGFLPEFLRQTQEFYGAGLREVNFAGDPEGARRTINAWVEEQTQNRIKDLVGPGAITRATGLVLTNAIYFKANWEHPFSERATRSEQFTLAADKTVNVPLMHQTAEFSYFDGGTFQALELPYQTGDLSMVVLLPRAADGLPGLESALTAERLEDCLSKLRPHQVEVSLPKFRTTCAFELKDTLSAMGMDLPFSRRADFSGMTEKERLFLSAVIHKAFVEVDEKGTEAAAATAVVITRAALPAPRPRVVFRADHPFVFLLRDRQTGSILFLGRLSNPAQG